MAAAGVFDAFGLADTVSEPWAVARSLFAGQGFAFDWYGLYNDPVPTSFLPPLYPWILSLYLKVTGGQDMPALYLAQGLNIILGVGTCLAVTLIVDATAPGRGTADTVPAGWRNRLRRPPLLAGLAWAVYPPALGHCARAHTPVLEGFLLVLLAYVVLRSVTAVSSGCRRWSVVAGAVLGLLLLVRPSYGLVWAVWCLVLLWRGRGDRARLVRNVLLTGLLATLVITPWTARNYQLHRRVVPIALNGGFNFYAGNNTQMAGDIPALHRFFSEFAPETPAYWQALSEVDRDRALYDLGLAYWRAEPGAALQGVFNRLVSYTFFRPYLFVAYPRWLAVIFVASYLGILLPLLWTLPHSRGLAASFSVSAILVTGLVGLVFVVSMRFRASVEPFFLVAAAMRRRK